MQKQLGSKCIGKPLDNGKENSIICPVVKQCTVTDIGTQLSMQNYLSCSLAVRYGITIKIFNIRNVVTDIDFKTYFIRISGYVIRNYGPGRPNNTDPDFIWTYYFWENISNVYRLCPQRCLNV
jgi:hypothetical protein